MADGDEIESKSSKKNKKRAQKRLETRLEKLKQDGVVQQILEQEDPVTALKKKLQQAKDNKDHKLAAELRQQIWMAQDMAAGCSVPEIEFEDNDATLPQKSNVKPTPSSFLNKTLSHDILNPTTFSQVSETTSSLTSIEKRLRALKKKLQQIHNLKEKQDKGEILEDMQIQKINTEDDIIAEIQEIESSLTGMSL